jgi:energy-coupling factor transporter ATP-binding protein EcfA2
MRSKIDKLHINNFKFFDSGKDIDLGGKHLLLYGENGSGKSSVYWSLYTLFECAFKDDEDITKYFKPITEHPQSLVNIYADMVDNGAGINHCNSSIKLTTTDTDPIDFEISLFNTAISGNTDAIDINKSSDFINYKVLYKFQDFWNGETINLSRIFTGYVLPYVKFNEINTSYKGEKHTLSNAYEMFNFIQKGQEIFDNTITDFEKINKQAAENFRLLVRNFDTSFEDLIDFINVNAPTLLLKLGYNIGFKLVYKKMEYKSVDEEFAYNYSIDFIITSYLGNNVTIERPQSFLNEAKITAIALAIRLTILNKRVTTEAPDLLKFIVFDDVMISLDMNNRDKLIDFILNKENRYIEDYQLLFLTHDKNLYDFVASKIKQWDNVGNWVFKEMYAGKNDALNKEYPIIIDSELEFIDKAQKYYDAKDYTACSIYIRKELEKIVNDRLPPVLKQKMEGTYLSLQTLWGNMVARYAALNKPITDDIKKHFDETKLMVLNPQAHFQDVSMPIYKVELDKALDLIRQIKANYPPPVFTILLVKGIKLKFKHPSTTFSYIFYFELLSDFFIDGMNGATALHFPKCKVNIWEYDGTDFYSPGQKKVIDSKEVHKRLEDKLDDVLTNLKKDTVLNITNQMFIDNTSIKNSIWSLKEILDKAKISF